MEVEDQGLIYRLLFLDRIAKTCIYVHCTGYVDGVHLLQVFRVKSFFEMLTQHM